ncbi:hypothetical protein EVG20_g5398 [Dentipellis fragilis]|uniref:DUF6533 domain-containing protein n=1 Tax=Dentipellis fragilis TaxID=205917 RepID=A0A4Y9YX40_9AGAM|nr:hypothetical protein EVG20_g5398 [Dentipellis fragilis]
MGTVAANQIIPAVLQSKVAVLCCVLSAGTLLLYDHLITLADEVEFIWGSRWSVVKVVFLLNRYIAFSNFGIAIYHQFGSNLSTSVCSRLFAANAWLIGCGVCMSEIILGLRTYALWGKSKRVGCALVALSVVTGTVMCAFLVKGASITFAQFPPIPGISSDPRGCFVTGEGGPTYTVSWSLTLASETIIVVLTLAKALQNCILAYLLLFALSVSNLFVVVAAPQEYTNLLSLPQHTLHVVLTSRIVLNIRRKAVDGALIDVSGTELEQTVLELATFSRKGNSG